MEYKHIFGPVPSRRLNLSLGIDLVPYKTCNLNCVYCECGITTMHTNCRANYVDYKEVIKELQHYLSKNITLDYITFSGAGEPLLNSNIGKIVDFLKTNFPQYKLALLTNGILLSQLDILKEISKIDLIIPSLDAGREDTFKKINNPVKGIDFYKYIDGLINLKKFYKNQVWIEVFLVKNINDSSSELEKLNEIIKKISPNKIQLNTIDRPPAFSNIRGLNQKEMEKAKSFFPNNCEIIKSFTSKKVISQSNIDLIINCLQRRPLTLEDLMVLTGLKVNQINKILRQLEAEKKITTTKSKRSVFYSVKNLK